MQETDPIQVMIIELSALPLQKREGQGKEELARKINELLNSDFQRLVSTLYRMDVSETKLRQLLKDNTGTDAGILIADLMIERHLLKIKTRRESASDRTKQQDNDIDEKEKW